MSIDKWTSVKEIIAKILSDSDIKDEAIRIQDIIVWCGEALRKIGGPQDFNNKIAGKNNNPLLTITNYRAVLPCDCYKIVQLGVSSLKTGPFKSARQATGSFDVIRDNTNVGESNYGDDITYTVNSPYIDINFKNGYGLLSYKAIKTDEDGYPSIPDNEAVKEALYWYCETKGLYALYRRGKIRDSVYLNAKKEWARCCNNAYNNIIGPTNDDEMASIANVWLRMIPTISGHDTSLKYIGNREERFNL